MSYLKKWPPFWRDDGQGNKVLSWKYANIRIHQTEERLNGSDQLLRDVADVVLELRANTERLEDILMKLREEDSGRK